MTRTKKKGPICRSLEERRDGEIDEGRGHGGGSITATATSTPDQEGGHRSQRAPPGSKPLRLLALLSLGGAPSIISHTTSRFGMRFIIFIKVVFYFLETQPCLSSIHRLCLHLLATKTFNCVDIWQTNFKYD